ncbi:MAG: hypothetical protein IJT88_09025 [Kiritimatiellae bacterium]|nr:hypothetical protein [Kiritimatiellia bacterium]
MDSRTRWAKQMEVFIAEMQKTQKTLLSVLTNLVDQAQEIPGGSDGSGWSDEDYCAIEKKLRAATEHYRKARANYVSAECDWEKSEAEEKGN